MTTTISYRVSRAAKNTLLHAHVVFRTRVYNNDGESQVFSDKTPTPHENIAQLKHACVACYVQPRIAPVAVVMQCVDARHSDSSVGVLLGRVMLCTRQREKCTRRKWFRTHFWFGDLTLNNGARIRATFGDD